MCLPGRDCCWQARHYSSLVVSRLLSGVSRHSWEWAARQMPLAPAVQPCVCKARATWYAAPQAEPAGLGTACKSPRTHRRAACFVQEDNGVSVAVQLRGEDVVALNGNNLQPPSHAVRSNSALQVTATAGPSHFDANTAVFGGVLHPEEPPAQVQRITSSNTGNGSDGHQQPFSVRKAAASRLTRSIKSCTAWQQLQDLHSKHRHDMDFIHLSALLTHLAQLHDTGLSPAAQHYSDSSDTQGSYGGSGQAVLEEWVQAALLPDLRRVAPELRPREAANVVWALAKLELRSNGSDTSLLLDIAWSHIPGMGSQELSNTLYASALLQQQLPGPALMATHQRLVALAPQLEPQAVSNIIWSLGCLQQRPHPAVTRVLLRRSYDQMYSLTAQGLCSLAYGLARMRVRMPAQFRERLLDAAWRLMQHQQQEDLWQPEQGDQHHQQDEEYGFGGQQAWKHRQVPRQQPPMNVQALVQLLWALVKDGSSPHPRWVAACLAQISAHVDHLAPIDAANLLWALAQMHIRPPVALLHALLQLLEEQLEALPPEGLACVAWSLSELRIKPAHQWADRYLRATYKGALAFWKEAVGPGSGGGSSGAGASTRAQPQRMHRTTTNGWSCRAAATILYALAKVSIRPTAKYMSTMLAVALLPVSSSTRSSDSGRAGDNAASMSAVQSHSGSSTTPQDLHYLAAALPAIGHEVPEWGLDGLSRMAAMHLPRLQGKMHEEAVAGLKQLGLEYACEQESTLASH